MTISNQTSSIQQPDCFICRKHQGQINNGLGFIYEDDYIYVGHILSNEPTTYLGYLIVDLKRHTPGLADATDEEASALGRMVTRVSRALKKCEGAEHIYSCVLGDHVPHLHIHVIARYPDTPREFWGLQIREWPDAMRGGSAAIEELCARIRDNLVNERTDISHQ